MRQVATDGSESRSLLLGGAGEYNYPSSWSPDGHLVYGRPVRGVAMLFIYSASDGPSRLLAEGAEASFSPDGRWIAYIGQGGVAGGGAVVVQRFPAIGGQIPISEPLGAQPRWNHDGTELFYIAPDRRLMAVAFDPATGSAGRPRPLFMTRIVAPNLAWFQYDVAPDGRFVINSFPSTTGSPLTLLTGWTPGTPPA
jgi:Tol biopolymer transport system component